jgi:hypothetical protein
MRLTLYGQLHFVNYELTQMTPSHDLHPGKIPWCNFNQLIYIYLWVPGV